MKLSTLFLLLLTVSSLAFAQPGAISTNNLIGAGTYDCTVLVDMGSFRQARIAAGTGSSTVSWELPATCGFPGDVWRPYSAGSGAIAFNTLVAPNGGTNTGALYNSGNGGSSGVLATTTNAYYYTFNVEDVSAPTNAYMQVLETSFNPVAISTVAQSPAVPKSGQSVTVTITTATAPAVGENVFVRYSTDGFVTSTIVAASFVTTTGTAVIPGAAGGTTVAYYVYSSNKTQSAIDAEVVTDGQRAHDLATLNLDNNGGTNYGYMVHAPLAGVYLIPGTYPTGFATLKSAIDTINAYGVGAPTTINVTAGYAETGIFVITDASASVSAPIVFQRVGLGPNPLITAGVGIGTNDGLIVISGTDYVTFDGFDVQENPANVTATTQMEYGFALLNADATNGPQNCVIKNCVIALNKTNVVSTGIYKNIHTTASTTLLTITTPGGTGSYNKFYSNAITNVYFGIKVLGYAAAAPYTYYDQNNEVGVDGANVFTNWGGGSTSTFAVNGNCQNNFKIYNNSITGGTATSTLRGIYIGTLSPGANVDVVNNTITLASGATSSSFVGIELNSALGTASIARNTITGCTYPLASSGTFRAIYYNATGATALRIDSNVVSNNTLPGTGALAAIEVGNMTTATPVNIRGNLIYGNLKTGGASGSFYGTRIGTSSATVPVIYAWNQILNNGTTVSNSSTFYGYYNGSVSTAEDIYGNTVRGLFVSVGTSSVYAIGTNTVIGAVKNIYGNTVDSIMTAGSTIYGIYHAAGTTVNIYRNTVRNMSSTNTGAGVHGIFVSSGTNVYVYNNFVSDLRAPAGTGTTTAVCGLNISGGTNVGAYYNTIHLNASSSSATSFGTSGIYASSTPIVDLRNNVVVNLSTPGPTGGFTVAHRRSSTTLTTYAAASNNNDFYVNPGAGPRRYYFSHGSTLADCDSTFPAYKTRVTGRDGSSFAENPPFVNAATTPFDLHMQLVPATQTESGGTPVTTPIAVAQDFDTDARNASTPDIGADEFTGTGLDLSAPNMAYTPLGNTSYTANRQLTVNITDASGVAGSPNGPHLYYKKSTDGAFVVDSAPTGTPPSYTFTINYALIGGGAALPGDTIQYYIAAADVPGNSGTSPAGGGGLPPGSTPPATFNSYRIVTASGLPFSENFNAGLTLPTGWGGTMSVVASHGTTSSNGLTRNLYSGVTSANANSPIIGLITAGSQIEFDYRIVNYTGYPGTGTTLGAGDSIVVSLSTDDGATYNRLYAINQGNHTTSANFAHITLPIAAYAGFNGVMKWDAYRGAGDYYVDIDNAQLREPPAGPPDPAGIVSPLNAAIDVSIAATLNWSAPTGGGPVSGYKLYFGDDGGGLTSPTNIVPGTNIGNLLTYDPSPDLAYSHTYYWQVVPTGAGGDATGCPIWSFTTGADPTVTTFPFAEGFESVTFPPTNWTSVIDSGTVNWNRVTAGTNPTQTPFSGAGEARYNAYSASAGYRARLYTPPLQLPSADYQLSFQMYHDNGYATPPYDSVGVEVSSDAGTTWARLATYPRYNATNAWQQHVVPLTGYSGLVRVGFHALSQYGNNMFIDSIRVFALPASPSGLTISNVTTDSLDLSWTDNSGDELGFYIYKSTDGTSFTKIDSTGAGVAAYTGDATRGLGANNHVWYRVTSHNGSGESGAYAAANGYTLANTPGAPAISDIGFTTMTVTLATAGNSAATQFAIRAVYAGPTTKYVDTLGALVDNPFWGTYAQFGGAGGRIVSGLTSGTLYTFDVKARNGADVESDYGTTASGTTTNVAPPNAPTGLFVSAVYVDSMDLGWTDNATDEDGFYIYKSNDGLLFNKIDSVGVSVQTYTGLHSRSLGPNARYWWRVAAYNANGASTFISADSTTLAEIPGTPLLASAAYTSMSFTLAPATNPAATEFAVRVVHGVTTEYLTTSGTLAGTEAWANAAAFGGGSGITVTGLTPGVSYAFDVKARNAHNIETIYGPGATLATPSYPSTFSEDFATYAGSAPPPTSWNEGDQKDILDGGTFGAYSNGSWFQDGFGNVGTTGAAKFNYYGSSSVDNDWLLGPAMSIPTSRRLAFDIALTLYGTTTGTTMDENDTLFVVVSTDGGATFPRSNVIGAYHAGTTISNTGQTEMISLSAFAGQANARIGFYVKDLAGAGDKDFFLDNVRVEPVVTKDIQVLSVTMTPGPPYFEGNAVTVNATIRNNGLEANPLSVPLTYKVGSAPGSSGDGTAETFTPSWTGSTATVSFTTTYTPTAMGSLSMYVNSFYAGDEVPANDGASASGTVFAQKDIRVASVSMTPGPPYYSGTALTVSAKIKNAGGETNPATVPLTYKLGSAPASQGDGTGEVVTPVWTGDSATVSFTVTYTPPTAGSNTMYVGSFYAGDEDAANDVSSLAFNVLPPGIFFEDWTAADAISRWKVINNDGGTKTWARSTAKFLSTPASAGSDYEGSTLQNDDWLITPKLSVAASDSFIFYHSARSASFPESLYVRISTTGNNVADFGTDLLVLEDATIDWKREAISLNAYAGQNVYVAFVNRGLDQFTIYVDDITGPALFVAAHDIGMASLNQAKAGTETNPSGLSRKLAEKLGMRSGDGRQTDESVRIAIVGPERTSFGKSAPVTFKAIVQNFGGDAEASYQVGWEIDGIPQTSVSNTRTLGIGERDTLTLSWAVPTDGFHQTRAWTILGTDINTANDTSGLLGFDILPANVLLRERFEGTFPPAGWLTVNRDGGGTTGPWFAGNPTVFTAYEGTGYAGDNYASANVKYIDDYLITPNNGAALKAATTDSLTFWLQSNYNAPPDPNYLDSLEIRVSTTGTDTSNFTTLLAYVEVPKTGWTRFAFALPPGASRYVAFRYLMYDGGTTGNYSDYIGLDMVEVTRHTLGENNNSIAGTMWQDQDNDGTRDPGDQPLAGWTVNITGPLKMAFTAITDSGGAYLADNLPAGDYFAEAALVPGWSLSTIPPAPITLTGNTHVSGIDFGMHHGVVNTISLGGLVYRDKNANSSHDGTEPVLAGWIAELKDSSNSHLAYDTTDAGGLYSFAGLTLGRYYVDIQMQNGWIPISPARPYQVDVVNDTLDLTVDFGNFLSTAVTGVVFNDRNLNGTKDVDEDYLDGWELQLTSDTTLVGRDTTDLSGAFSFANLGPGTYTVTEIMQAGWTAVNPPSGSFVVTIANDDPVSPLSFGNVLGQDTVKYRTISMEQYANAVDAKGKYKLISKKADKVDFEFTLPIVNAASGVTFKFSMVASGTIKRGLTTLASFTASKMATYTGSLASGDILTVTGLGAKGKALKATYVLTTLPKATKGTVTSYVLNQPRLPMPNEHNLGTELFAGGGFAATTGLLVGVPHPENPKAFGWVLQAKYKDVQKSLRDKSGIHTGGPRCFDLFASNKPLVKLQKSLPPTKQNNKLFAELVTLKMNIAASEIGIIPNGIGQLKYADAGNPLDGQTVQQISATADAFMTNCPTTGPITAALLDSVVRKINIAFSGVMDTVAWAAGLELTGVKRLGDVDYLQYDASIPPVVVDRTPYTPSLPDAYALHQNYPNPFNPSTTLSFDLPEVSIVTVKIFNVLGQEIATLIDREQMDEGTQEIDFDAAELSTGVYYFRLVVENADEGNITFSQVKKMMLVK